MLEISKGLHKINELDIKSLEQFNKWWNTWVSYHQKTEAFKEIAQRAWQWSRAAICEDVFYKSTDEKQLALSVLEEDEEYFAVLVDRLIESEKLPEGLKIQIDTLLPKIKETYLLKNKKVKITSIEFSIECPQGRVYWKDENSVSGGMDLARFLYTARPSI